MIESQSSKGLKEPDIWTVNRHFLALGIRNLDRAPAVVPNPTGFSRGFGSRFEVSLISEASNLTLNPRASRNVSQAATSIGVGSSTAFGASRCCLERSGYLVRQRSLMINLNSPRVCARDENRKGYEGLLKASASNRSTQPNRSSTPEQSMSSLVCDRLAL